MKIPKKFKKSSRFSLVFSSFLLGVVKDLVKIKIIITVTQIQLQCTVQSTISRNGEGGDRYGHRPRRPGERRQKVCGSHRLTRPRARTHAQAPAFSDRAATHTPPPPNAVNVNLRLSYALLYSEPVLHSKRRRYLVVA